MTEGLFTKLAIWRRLWTALLGLALYDLILRRGGFSAVHRKVRTWKTAGRKARRHRDNQIVSTVKAATGWYPKSVLCLQRSAVLTCLLRRAGTPAEMVLGVRRIPFYAHAWVEVNGVVVNDEDSVRTEYETIDRL